MASRWLPAALLLLLCLLASASGGKFWRKADHHKTPDPELVAAVEEDSKTMDQAMIRASALKNYRSSAGKPHNYEHMSGYDMKLTRSQYQRLHGGKKTRSASRILAVPWTNGTIPYEIQTSDFNEKQMKWIKKAMRDWERYSCVRFRPATSADTQHKIFIRQGSGCWAHLGMINQYPQIVNLETGAVGCFWKGLIHHELGHTIGLIHEHQRETRDAYIRVDYYTVASNMIDAVEKYAKGVDDKMGLDYDYTSVMHYGKTAFSSGFYRQTIYTRDRNKEDVIGMTLLPSFTDFKLVNLMYNCADKCRQPPSCPADCYVSADCKCVCKEDMPKEDCRDLFSDCEERAKRGDCINSYGSMHHSCRKTCGICNNNGSVPHVLCLNVNSNCMEQAAQGKCDTDYTMQYYCRLACGLCKTPDMLPQPGPCVDRSRTCRQMAARGDCYRKMASTLRNCSKSCEFCPENLGKDPTDKKGCVDYDPGACTYRADSNLCNKYYTLMAMKCPVACGRCDNFTLPDGCADTKTECPGWAMGGECDNNPRFMLKGCKLSCDTCDGLNKPQMPCEDYNLNCEDYTSRDECFANPSWMSKNCKKSCKHCPGDPPFGIPCRDFSDRCAQWARQDECTSNPGWMWPHCMLSCGKCEAGTVDYNNGTCRDGHLECFYWYANGECTRNPAGMRNTCQKSCGVCTPDGGSTNRPTERPTDAPSDVCEDKNINCKDWADHKHCQLNPGYMLVNCKRSCKICPGPNQCRDQNQYCEDWAKVGYCQRRPDFMLPNCKKSCKRCN